MTTTTHALGQRISERILKHYGVKGMKWGVRNDDRSPRPVVTKEKPGRRVRAKGGQLHPPSEDAINAARSRQIAKRSTTDALSNKDLQHLVSRMQLENNYHQIMTSDARMGIGKQVARNLLREFDGDLVNDLAVGVGTAVGKPISEATQAKIKFGTNITRVAFAVKGGSGSGKKKKR